MNVRRVLKILTLTAGFALLCGPAFAVLFTAEDKGFTIDLPSAWVRVSGRQKGSPPVNAQGQVVSVDYRHPPPSAWGPINPQGQEVLSLERDAAIMKISLVPGCRDAQCIVAEITKALDFVKSKKFRVLENTYSGDIIKSTEFSTGDPLFSFNYSGAAVDFTTAYFLSGGKAYLVGIKGIPYVEADLILSFISPAARPTDAKAGARAPRVLDEPFVEDILGGDAAPAQPARQPVEEAQPLPPPGGDAGPGVQPFQIIVSAAALYFFAILIAFALRLILPAKLMPDAANPRSSYPVKGLRLYGSPDLFFKLHDNQGNNYIANSGRWGGIFMGLGLAGALLFFLLEKGADYAFTNGLIIAHVAVVNTIGSLSSLLGVLGLIVFAAGFALDMLFGSKIFIYNSKGELAFKAVQKGINPFREEYIVADAKSAILLRLRRARFAPLRKWIIYDNGAIVAEIRESSLPKALLRMLLGHMCGFLRADYEIKGRFESKGTILSYGRVFTYFRSEIDKPEAIAADTILAATALIYIRDRDKWHPWVN